MTNGLLIGNSPVYGIHSWLIYSKNGSVNRGREWAMIGNDFLDPLGKGYPYHVKLTNNSSMNGAMGDPSRYLQTEGNLQIDAGSGLSIGFTATSTSLRVKQHLHLYGRLTLPSYSTTIENDALEIGGDFLKRNAAVFTSNNRPLRFLPINPVHMMSSTALNEEATFTISRLLFAPSTNGHKVTLKGDLTLNGQSGELLQMPHENDRLELMTQNVNAYSDLNIITTSGTLAMNGRITNNVPYSQVFGLHTIKLKSTSGNMGVLRLGDGYWFYFDIDVANSTANTPANLAIETIGRPTVERIQSVANNSDYVQLIGGVLGIENNASAKIIVDGRTHPTAFLRKYLLYGTAISVYDSPNSNNGSEQSTINFANPNNKNLYFDIQVVDEKPVPAGANYISRYFNVRSNLPTNSTLELAATHQPTDVVGDINSMRNYAVTNTGLKTGSLLTATNNRITNNQFKQNSAVMPDRVVPIYGMDLGPQLQVYDPDTTTVYDHESTIDLGTFEQGGSHVANLNIGNIGLSTLTITGTAGSQLAPFITVNLPLGSVPVNLSNIVYPHPFTLTVNASTVGTHTGYLIINNNNVEHPDFRLNITFKVVPAVPIIAVSSSATNQPILNNGEPSSSNQTDFGEVQINSITWQTFKIKNLASSTAVFAFEGTPKIRIEGEHASDFSVATQPAENQLNPNEETSFTISFAPTYFGTRHATVVFDYNGIDFRFHVQGRAHCQVASLLMNPLNGPAGTIVSMSITGGTSISQSHITFGGIQVPLTSVEGNTAKFIVPDHALNGIVKYDLGRGCELFGSFSYVVPNSSGCMTTAPTGTELYISEIFDSAAIDDVMIEITNPTASAVSLSDYTLEINYGETGLPPSTIVLSGGSIPAHSSYVVLTSLINAAACMNYSQVNVGKMVFHQKGINFKSNEHDNIQLKKSGVVMDSFGVFGDSNWADGWVHYESGMMFRRKMNHSIASATFQMSDWDYLPFSSPQTQILCHQFDLTHLGKPNLSGIPPVVNPVVEVILACHQAELRAIATEGIPGGSELTYQWYINQQPHQGNFAMIADNATFSGANTAVLTVKGHQSYSNYQFFCLVSESGSNCSAPTHAMRILPHPASVWDGNSWSPFPPTDGNTVYIDGSYNTAMHGSLDVCDLVVSSNLAIAPDTFVEVQNFLTMRNYGRVDVMESGQFIQSRDLSGIAIHNNMTKHTYTRTTSPFNRFDYTYWSSPLMSSYINSVFNGWRTDYAFYMNTANFLDLTDSEGNPGADGHDDDSNDWIHHIGLMTPGRGYAVMGPTNLGAYPATKTVTFSTGYFNTRTITVPIQLSANHANDEDDFNLIGNPYPSAVDADLFIQENLATTSGALYFWTHSIPISASLPGNESFNFSTNDYAIYTMLSAIGTGHPSSVPNGTIPVAQGFMIDAEVNGNVLFKNTMRNKNLTNTQFFRTTEAYAQKDLYHLKVTQPEGFHSETVVGYLPHATLGKDKGYDAVAMPATNAVHLYTIQDALPYKLQARPSFEIADTVALGFSTLLQGEFTLELTQLRGLFAEGQAIYVYDTQTQMEHPLHESAFTFTTEPGTFETRFELRYQPQAELGISNPENQPLRFYSNAFELGVYAGNETIESIKIHDLNGKTLYQAEALHTSHWQFNPPNWSKQYVLVEVKLTNGKSTTRQVAIH